MKFTVSQRVEVNKFWVSKKMQIESSFSFKMCFFKSLKAVKKANEVTIKDLEERVSVLTGKGF